MQDVPDRSEVEQTSEIAAQQPTEPDGPPAPPDAAVGPERAWWSRPAVLISAAGAAVLLVGLVIGSSGGSQDLEVAEAAVTEVAAERDGLRAELEAAQTRSEELEPLEGEVDRLEAELTDAEAQRDRAVGDARSELKEERDRVLSEAQDEADDIIASAEEQASDLLDVAEGRVAALDEREAALDERAEELDVAEERQAASSFGNGVHIVGTDIEAGLYRTEGGSNCYWARLSGLSGGFGDLTANGLPDGPANVEIRPSDAGFESSGCATWNRVD